MHEKNEKLKLEVVQLSGSNALRLYPWPTMAY